MIMRVVSMTPEQIARLPPSDRANINQLVRVSLTLVCVLEMVIVYGITTSGQHWVFHQGKTKLKVHKFKMVIIHSGISCVWHPAELVFSVNRYPLRAQVIFGF